jgi:hypothetical protein
MISAAGLVGEEWAESYSMTDGALARIGEALGSVPRDGRLA